MLAPFLAAVSIILPHVPGVYQGPPCAGHPARPPASYTTALKIRQLRALHYRDQNPSHYEEDHLVQLSLGGDPRSPNNLWPQPWRQAHRDDDLEFSLYKDVCWYHTKTASSAVRYEKRYKHAHG